MSKAEKSYVVELSCRVFKNYEIKASSAKEAESIVRKWLNDGNVCVWTDGFEASTDDDEKIKVSKL